MLERRLFHKVLVASNKPADWPPWLVAAVALLPTIAVAGLWWMAAGGMGALIVAVIQVLFTASDALALVNLPRSRISFGPVGPQLLILEIPRLVMAAVAVVLAIWAGMIPALIAVVVINAGASLALLWGAFKEPARLGLSRYSFGSDSLPGGAPPIRLLQVSDLHVERLGRREEQVVQMVREVAADVVVLTGDYVNLSCVDDPIAHADARRVLAAMAEAAASAHPTSPANVYAVLGSPPVDRNSAPLFDGLPIRLLRDEVVTLDVGQGRQLALLGLDCTHDPGFDGQQLARMADRVPEGLFRVLLYHSPDLMLVAPRLGMDLYLCGHTHGGQVRLPFYGAIITSSRVGKRYEMGHYQAGRTHLYVSRGIGLEGMSAPRVRFLCPPEITLFSLGATGAGSPGIPGDESDASAPPESAGPPG